MPFDPITIIIGQLVLGPTIWIIGTIANIAGLLRKS